MKTAQEIFDKVISGLSSQGFKQSVSQDNHYSCSYFGHSGRKCAIGYLINDDLYQEDFEGLDFSKDMDLRNALIHSDIDVENYKQFMMYLQEAHDFGTTPDSMIERILAVADRLNLCIPEGLKKA